MKDLKRMSKPLIASVIFTIISCSDASQKKPSIHSDKQELYGYGQQQQQIPQPTPTVNPETQHPIPKPTVNPGQTPEHPCISQGVQTMEAFNLFVFKNLTQSATDVEGRLAVGGDAVLQSYAVGAALARDFSRYDLIVGRNLSFQHGSVSNGKVAVGGAANIANLGLLSALEHTQPLNFHDLELQLKSYSFEIDQLETNGITNVQPIEGGRANIMNLSGSQAINVFRLNASDLSRTRSFSIHAPSYATVFVNIDGNQASVGNLGLSYSGGVTREQVLFNFGTTRSLFVSQISFEGHLLAPYAELQFQNGVIQGSVVVDSLVGNGQINRTVPRICTRH